LLLDANRLGRVDCGDDDGNARRTGLTVLALSAVTGLVGMAVLVLQRNGYIHADPFIGSSGMIVFSLINAACGCLMLKPPRS
jgi:hypothetical protein